MARPIGPSGRTAPSAQQLRAAADWSCLAEQQQRGVSLSDAPASRAELRRRQQRMQAERLKQGRGSDL